MYRLRKIGFYITLSFITLAIIVLLVILGLGIELVSENSAFEQAFGFMTVFTGIVFLIILLNIGVLMLLYNNSIIIPILFFIIFGFFASRITAYNSGIFYLSLGLTIGPFMTIIGYFFKEPNKMMNKEIIQKNLN